MTVIVTTQQQLDQALADGAKHIVIDSPAGVWLAIRPGAQRDSSRIVVCGYSRVVACGHSEIEAWGYSSVEACGSSKIQAWDSARIVARDSSSVEARDSTRIEAWDSASVKAWGSASVEAWDSSRIVARGSSRIVARGYSRIAARDSANVEARGHSRIEARGSSSVEAWDCASVEAWGSSSVHARGEATVTAGTHVAVHLHSAQATVTGGVVIDVASLDLTDPQTWCDHHGVTVRDGRAVLYKAVDEDLVAGHGYRLTTYAVGRTVAAGDWRDDHKCGGGLHASPSPHQARAYCVAQQPRFLRVSAPVESIRPIEDDKCKAACWLVEAEVDMWREEIAPVEGGAS